MEFWGGGFVWEVVVVGWAAVVCVCARVVGVGGVGGVGVGKRLTPSGRGCSPALPRRGAAARCWCCQRYCCRPGARCASARTRARGARRRQGGGGGGEPGWTPCSSSSSSCVSCPPPPSSCCTRPAGPAPAVTRLLLLLRSWGGGGCRCDGGGETTKASLLVWVAFVRGVGMDERARGARVCVCV